jgi:hypothetical protein
MDTISAEDFCSAIYGATTPVSTFISNDEGGITFVARVLDAGVEEYYRVVFEMVTNFTWRDDGGEVYVPNPSDLFEFSAIEIASAASGWRFESTRGMSVSWSFNARGSGSTAHGSWARASGFETPYRITSPQSHGSRKFEPWVGC